MSETLKIGYVASGPSYPMVLNRPTSSLGPIVAPNCMLAWIVILLNQKVYCVKNVYARISLNRSFSDTIFQLMWDTKKSENILMCVRCPSTPPWTRLRYQYVLRSDTEGRLHVLHVRPFVSKLKQNAITMNSNNVSKIFR